MLGYQGTIGVPDGHESAPAELTITHLKNSQATTESTSDEFLRGYNDDVVREEQWPFSLACSNNRPVFIESVGDRNEGFEARGWPERPKQAVLIPITSEGQLSAVAIVGLNPRRPWIQGK
jgi:hypothetical protein